MREIVNLNRHWAFAKGAQDHAAVQPDQWEKIDLPHTWNAVDGQDGGGDYYRGHGLYVRAVNKAELPQAEQYYLEINGANASAEVRWNGKVLARHDGGYSTWRVLLPEVQDENLLVIDVDNSTSETVYPQVADFTFYGGLYRTVNLLCVSSSHFDLVEHGGPGLWATPDVETKTLKLSAALTGVKDGQTVAFILRDGEGAVVGKTAVPAQNGRVRAAITLNSIHLWNGRKDPYLYTVEAALAEEGAVLDNVRTRVGFRSFRVDPERGFILNGQSYPLRGVSRHQDRWGIGNALLPQHHEEDIALICELGATTIRLAHYQHDQYFYNLCDEKGLVIWAEIPYISHHMPGGRQNTVSQMTELITQNYNHPCIVCWGLSNEITIGGMSEDLMENHRILNDLVHKMDPTRPTAMACMSTCSMDEPLVQIPDLISYNHYFGWYGGDTDMNGPWFDKFHKKYPKIPIGVSEYGCEALNWHTSDPQQGDYTEEYQAYYHEELIKQLYTRPYIWATHCWNMFDFGCDARSEGGEAGQNHKGLVTIDRKYKKDAFYAYKAWLSDEPFVHLCGKRYVDRVEDVTKVTVYSNLPAVELFANGVSLGVKEAADHFFYFQVPNKGETVLTAVAGDCRDESRIRKVDVFNEEYRLKEKNAVLNWFDITAPEGYFSLNDKISDIASTFRGKLLLAATVRSIIKMAKNKNAGGEKKSGGMDVSGILKNKGLMQMIGSFTILRISGMAGIAGITFTKEWLLDLNAKLNRIRKKKK